MAVTAHMFVTEVVAAGLNYEPTDLEKLCEIAILDQVPGISARDARKAVLAVHAMMAWQVPPPSPTPAPTPTDSGPPGTATRSSDSSG